MRSDTVFYGHHIPVHEMLRLGLMFIRGSTRTEMVNDVGHSWEAISGLCQQFAELIVEDIEPTMEGISLII